MDINVVGHVAADGIVVFKENLALPRRKSIISQRVYCTIAHAICRARARSRAFISAHPHTLAQTHGIADEFSCATCHSAYRMRTCHAESVTIEGNYCNRSVSEFRD